MNKRLAILLMGCIIVVMVGGLSTSTLYGTEYLESKINYSYSIGPWWNSSFGYRKLITINSSRVTDNLTNFPVLISTTSDANLSSHAQEDGDDIAFVMCYGHNTQINHEIELFNGTTGELVAWINVTSVSSTEDTVLYMYYGNSTCNSQENITGVWDSNFVGTWHLNESGIGTRFDSTSNNNNGSTSGYEGDEAITAGKIDGADEFDGVDDYANCSNDSGLDITNNLTISVWAKPNVAGEGKTNAAITSKADDKIGWSWQLRYNATGVGSYMGFQFNAIPEGSTWVSVNQNLSPGIWYYITGTFNGSDIKCYLNGTEKSANQISAINSSMSPLLIGQDGWDNMFNGTIDEVRISNVARTPAWINTSFNNQNDTSNFFVFGREETPS